MAGGEGTRLRPLTCNVPKPMMSIMEKPVLQYTIELLKNHGIFDIGITLQYLPDEIMNYFGDGTRCGCNVKGTIDSIETAHDNITIYIADSKENISSYGLYEIYDEKEGAVKDE